MKRKELFKLKTWSKGDYFKFVTAIVVNVIIFLGILVMTIALNGIGRGKVPVTFEKYFADFQRFLYLGLTTILVIVVQAAYLYIEHRDFTKSVKNVYMVFIVMEVCLLCSYFAGRYVSIYFRPLALGALLLLLLTNKRLALFTNFTICLMTFLMDIFTNTNFDYSTHAQYSSLIIGFVTGTIGIFLIDGVYSRIKVVLRGMLILIPILLCLLLLEQTDMFIHWERLLAGASSGVVTVMIFVMILPIFEALFNKVTDYKLVELTDHSAPLIKEMIENAPGTFNHSIVVSNLAEACANSIGESAILARCAAYYHDMGKLRQPEFFKENQMDGKNPHDEITPELSTNIIKSHTKDGAELIRKYRLPNVLADVCTQHHGTMPILYFYGKARQFTDGEVDVENFCYAGPKPQTKIAAIIMISDACEAAVRILKERTRENVDGVVEKIIDERLKLQQFDECEITMKELSIIRNTIVNNLSGIYHKRIEYPKIDLEQLKGVEDHNE